MENKEAREKIILVVDDDPTVIELYKRMFKNYGLDVLVARDGDKGLKMIKEQKPDFVILDIRMPKLDGIEVMKEVRKDASTKDTPVLILTNYDLEEYRREVAKLDVVDFVTKIGIDPSALVRRVIDFLANQRQVSSK